MGGNIRGFLKGVPVVLAWALAGLLIFLPCASGRVTGAGVLQEYTASGGDAFGFELVGEKGLGEAGTARIIRLTSHTWRGLDWEHWLTLIVPGEIKYKDAAVLMVVGGMNRPEPPSLERPEIPIFAFIAGQAGVPVAVLGQVPNQPLWGLREDALIASTFVRFMEEGDAEWPLLLPMAKSAVRAMDAVQQFSRDTTGKEIERFVVGGGSKRGWTAYLAAAADKRVKGIVPAVIDMLNIPEQMKRQMKTYGGYSEMISDYYELGLMEKIAGEEAGRLLEIVDPYSYRELLTMPKLIMLGTNDPYWTLDAANLYFPELPPPAYLHYAPDTGHDISLDSIPTLVEFIHGVFSEKPLPDLRWEQKPGGSLEVRWESDAADVTLMTAKSPDRDFREAEWKALRLYAPDNSVTVRPAVQDRGYIAYFVRVRFEESTPAGGRVDLSTGVTILPDIFPYTESGQPRVPGQADYEN